MIRQVRVNNSAFQQESHIPLPAATTNVGGDMLHQQQHPPIQMIRTLRSGSPTERGCQLAQQQQHHTQQLPSPAFKPYSQLSPQHSQQQSYHQQEKGRVIIRQDFHPRSGSSVQQSQQQQQQQQQISMQSNGSPIRQAAAAAHIPSSSGGSPNNSYQFIHRIDRSDSSSHHSHQQQQSTSSIASSSGAGGAYGSPARAQSPPQLTSNSQKQNYTTSMGHYLQQLQQQQQQQQQPQPPSRMIQQQQQQSPYAMNHLVAQKQFNQPKGGNIAMQQSSPQHLQFGGTQQGIQVASTTNSTQMKVSIPQQQQQLQANRGGILPQQLQQIQQSDKIVSNIGGQVQGLSFEITRLLSLNEKLIQEAVAWRQKCEFANMAKGILEQELEQVKRISSSSAQKDAQSLSKTDSLSVQKYDPNSIGESKDIYNGDVVDRYYEGSSHMSTPSSSSIGEFSKLHPSQTNAISNSQPYNFQHIVQQIGSLENLNQPNQQNTQQSSSSASSKNKYLMDMNLMVSNGPGAEPMHPPSDASEVSSSCDFVVTEIVNGQTNYSFTNNNSSVLVAGQNAKKISFAAAGTACERKSTTTEKVIQELELKCESLSSELANQRRIGQNLSSLLEACVKREEAKSQMLAFLQEENRKLNASVSHQVSELQNGINNYKNSQKAFYGYFDASQIFYHQQSPHIHTANSPSSPQSQQQNHLSNATLAAATIENSLSNINHSDEREYHSNKNSNNSQINGKQSNSSNEKQDDSLSQKNLEYNYLSTKQSKRSQQQIEQKNSSDTNENDDPAVASEGESGAQKKQPISRNLSSVQALVEKSKNICNSVDQQVVSFPSSSVRTIEFTHSQPRISKQQQQQQLAGGTTSFESFEFGYQLQMAGKKGQQTQTAPVVSSSNAERTTNPSKFQSDPTVIDLKNAVVTSTKKQTCSEQQQPQQNNQIEKVKKISLPLQDTDEDFNSVLVVGHSQSPHGNSNGSRLPFKQQSQYQSQQSSQAIISSVSIQQEQDSSQVQSSQSSQHYIQISQLHSQSNFSKSPLSSQNINQNNDNSYHDRTGFVISTTTPSINNNNLCTSDQQQGNQRSQQQQQLQSPGNNTNEVNSLVISFNQQALSSIQHASSPFKLCSSGASDSFRVPSSFEDRFSSSIKKDDRLLMSPQFVNLPNQESFNQNFDD